MVLFGLIWAPGGVGGLIYVTPRSGGPLSVAGSHISGSDIVKMFQKIIYFGLVGLFSPGTGLGTSKFEISGSKSPRGLIQSLGGWNRTDFCTHNGRRRYGLDGMD